MKTSALLFLAGIALGVAGMLIFQPAADQGNSSSTSSEDTIDGVPLRLRPLTRENKPSRNSEKRHVDRRDIQYILKELIESISQIDDESQLDVMSLIRQVSIFTRINESEAIDLLNQLSEPPPPGSNGNNDDFRKIASIIIFTRLCELNGPEAMRMAAEGQINGDRDEVVIAIGMNSWVAADPEGAQRWFEGLANDVDSKILRKGDNAESSPLLELLENESLRQAYFNGMAKQNPEGLEERIHQFKTDDVRDTMREDLMTALIAQESKPEGLLEILNKSTDLDEVRIAAVEKLSELDLHQAANWVEHQAAGPAHDHEVTAVAERLMEQDSDAGIDWYMKQEMHVAGRENDRTSRIVHHLAAQDVSRASQWVEQQPDNITRDYAEVSMASTFANRAEWDHSMSWISQVEDSELRNSTLNQILQRGWDKREGQLKPEVIAAAQAAGFGKQAGSYQPK